jgi:hypothetical protein
MRAISIDGVPQAPEEDTTALTMDKVRKMMDELALRLMTTGSTLPESLLRQAQAQEHERARHDAWNRAWYNELAYRKGRINET